MRKEHLIVGFTALSPFLFRGLSSEQLFRTSSCCQWERSHSFFTFLCRREDLPSSPQMKSERKLLSCMHIHPHRACICISFSSENLNSRFDFNNQLLIPDKKERSKSVFWFRVSITSWSKGRFTPRKSPDYAAAQENFTLKVRLMYLRIVAWTKKRLSKLKMTEDMKDVSSCILNVGILFYLPNVSTF